MVYAQPSTCPRMWHTQTPMGFWHTNSSPNLGQKTRPYNYQQKKKKKEKVQNCETSTKPPGTPAHLDQSSLTALDSLSCRLVTSAVRCRLAIHVTLRQLPSLSPFVQFLSRSLTHFWSRRDRRLRPFYGFAPKQTKGSSAWQTTYIVLQISQCCCFFKFFLAWMAFHTFR